MKVIEFENISFSYEDEGTSQNADGVFGLSSAFSLDGLNFSVDEGEFVAVLGHNGSGKSTLARLTNGLLSPKDGKITVHCDYETLFTVKGSMPTSSKNLFCPFRRSFRFVFQA